MTHRDKIYQALDIHMILNLLVGLFMAFNQIMVPDSLKHM